MTPYIHALIVASLFIVPYLIVMWFAGKYNATLAAASKQKLLREIAYDAAAYAFEQKAKALKVGYIMAPDEQMALAVGYMQKTISVSSDQAQRLIESILAKVAGAGATGKDKI